MLHLARKIATAVRVFRAEGMQGIVSVLRKKTYTSTIAVSRRVVRPLMRPLLPSVPEFLIKYPSLTGLLSLDLPSIRRVHLEYDADDVGAEHLRLFGLDATFGGETVALFLWLLQTANTVIDVGAHTGLYTLVAAVQNPRRTVYAFEPVPRIFRRLEKNLQLNRAGNAHAYQCAVTECDGEVSIHVPPGKMPTDSSSRQGFRRAEEVISVKAVTLDSFASGQSLGRVDLVKIDTETTEHNVLKGAAGLIRAQQPLIICEVLAGTGVEELLHNSLDGSGYSYFWITREGLLAKDRIEGDCSFRYLNYLFVPTHRVPQMHHKRHRR